MINTTTSRGEWGWRFLTKQWGAHAPDLSCWCFGHPKPLVTFFNRHHHHHLSLRDKSLAREKSKSVAAGDKGEQSVGRHETAKTRFSFQDSGGSRETEKKGLLCNGFTLG